MVSSIVLSVLLTVSIFINFVLLKISLVASKMNNMTEEMFDDENENSLVTVAFYNERAYWIDSDGLKSAPIDEDRNVFVDQAESIDAMNMDSDELLTIGKIVDAIKESD